MAEAGEVPAEQLANRILEAAPPHFGKNIRVRLLFCDASLALRLRCIQLAPGHAAARPP